MRKVLTVAFSVLAESQKFKKQLNIDLTLYKCTREIRVQFAYYFVRVVAARVKNNDPR